MSRTYYRPRSEVPETSLRIQQYNNLRSLFETKEWPIEEDMDISIFNRYYHTLRTLTEEQQDFLIELSYRFLHVTQASYIDYIVPPLKMLREKYVEEYLYFIPARTEQNKGKCTSTLTVLYLLRGTTMRTKLDLGVHSVVDDVEQLDECLPKKKPFKLVIVDDFIGSGQTIVDSLEYLNHSLQREIPPTNIKVICLVAMQDGIRRLGDMGVEVFSMQICNRGISDYYTGDKLERALDIMKSIEDGIKKLGEEFRLGYHQSEALVCMERCPNNTFPIYWKQERSPYERG